MAARGYGTYHGRNRRSRWFKVMLAVLVVLVLLAVGLLAVMDRYMVYSAEGVRLELPFLHKTHEPESTAPLIVSTPVPAAPTAEPEPEAFRGLSLDLAALLDGTAAEQVQAAGANAAIFEMKRPGGTLGYTSALALAEQAGVSATDPERNEVIQSLNESGLYTVAWVSCFRDNAIPRTDMSLAVRSSVGNWRDGDDIRWLSVANPRARQYVVGVCAELAALGFDELLLDNCGFPTQGRLASILPGENYDPEGLNEALELFLEELEQALTDWPGVRVSILSSDGVLAGGENDPSGQTAELLARYAARVWVSRPEDEGNSDAAALEDGQLVTVVEAFPDGDGNYAILRYTEEE